MEKIERLIHLVESEFGECPAWQPVIADAKAELRWFMQQTVAVREVVRYVPVEVPCRR